MSSSNHETFFTLAELAGQVNKNGRIYPKRLLLDKWLVKGLVTRLNKQIRRAGLGLTKPW